MTHDEIRREAETLNYLRSLAAERLKEREISRLHLQQYRDAIQMLREHPFPFTRFITSEFRNRVRTRDSAERESAIAFLEVDPWCDQSGYVKERVLRALGGADLTPFEIGRLQKVMLDVVRSRPRREFRNYCRFAQRIADAHFVKNVRNLFSSRKATTRRHAQWMYEYVSRVVGEEG